MKVENTFAKIMAELRKGMALPKCRKCGCMKEALESISAAGLMSALQPYLERMEPIAHHCLGCKHCFGASATNLFNEAFPEMANQPRRWTFEVKEKTWPLVPGEYFAFCEGTSCPVAVSTLASIDLAEALARNRPRELCIVGKTETENIGIDKVIKNTITNPTIRFLIVAGADPQGHHSGQTLLALSANGVNQDMKVVGSAGRRPVLNNVSLKEVTLFRQQVRVINMLGCEDTSRIIERIKELSRASPARWECAPCPPALSSRVPEILARPPAKLKMDRAGYFVVIPQREESLIIVEHYNYNNKLLHIIKGKDAPSIYSTIIKNGWLTQLSHSAYLGRELARAEHCLKYGTKYIQDKAPGKKGNTLK